MHHYEFLGLPQSQWEFINTFADWFSAIGTILAVWVSLWLARQASLPKARITASVMRKVGESGLGSEFLGIQIANVGDRPFIVTGLMWRAGLPFFRKHAFQPIENALLPMELQLGRNGLWEIDLDRLYADGQTWPQ